jgi:hypothetical protein
MECEDAANFCEISLVLPPYFTTIVRPGWLEAEPMVKTIGTSPVGGVRTLVFTCGTFTSSVGDTYSIRVFLV